VANQTLAYYLALGSSLAFASASLLFADLSRKISPLWMNAFKALFAWGCFALMVLAGGGWTEISRWPLLALFASGMVGLGLGDVFLLTAYARMGAARTLILFGFQPLFLAVEGYFFFHQQISWTIGLAVLFFLACLFTFSLERFKKDGHWEWIGLVAALIGVTLDNCGVILTRWSFDSTPAMNAFQANLVRCTGALLFFALFNSLQKVHLVDGWKRLGRRGQRIACFAAFLGTFFSLCLYLSAIKIGHLASISGLAVAGPIFASAMECLYLWKRPSGYLIVALSLFLSGFALLTF
jgi:drug/metabolite transporter (DMT)-like permease